ncbi:major facilitator superfamily protein [Escherichia coli]|uniref:Major facilitator superfamily protein n=1 Tax=Escherichia coli TaxID=562 RepID=A0A376S7S9_ECOLX|nr:major facilitator superfamily protein [Escherichia coli]
MAISQWQRFIWLASSWHSTDNLLQACHTLCRSNYLVSTPWGSLLCVFITAPLIRNTVRPTTLLMLYTFISFIALFTVCLHPTFYVVIIFAFVIGFTSAGGVVQIGLTLMAERFPYAKGKATGIYYSAGSIATFTIPLITAHLSQRSIADIMWFDTAIAAIGFLLALFIGLRSRKETQHNSLKENVAPGG